MTQRCVFSVVAVGSILCVVLLAAAAQQQFAARPGADAKAEPHPPVVGLAGSDSKITERRFVVVRDEPSWRALWAEHTGKPDGAGPPDRHAVPRIDFSRYMVVGAFTGDSTNTDGNIADEVAPTSDGLVVRYTPSTFQTMSAVPGQRDSGVRSTAFGIWIVEAHAGPVIFQRAHRGLKDSPVEWREVARIPARP